MTDQKNLNTNAEGASDELVGASSADVQTSGATTLSAADGRAYTKHPDGKVHLAVFDVDGTVIRGQSPAIMAYMLFKEGSMSAASAIRAGIWGIKYKAGLTTETVDVRRRVFKPFINIPSEKADQVMADIYRSKVSPRLRKMAREKIKWHQQHGDEVIFVTGSFEPIAKMLAADTSVHAVSATRMAKEDGSYTGDVEGVPVEGQEKVVRLRDYADKRYGEGNWVLDYSYADHVTDVPILEMANHPVAVNPKRKLLHVAKRRGWEIQDW